MGVRYFSLIRIFHAVQVSPVARTDDVEPTEYARKRPFLHMVWLRSGISFLASLLDRVELRCHMEFPRGMGIR